MSKEIVIPYAPRPQQKEIHKNLKRFNVLVCHRRFGKALALDTPVPMADGSWSNMGELKAGDIIIGSDGRPTTVSIAHDVLFDRKCYEVEVGSGDKIVADADHLWLTTRKKDRHNPVRHSDGSRINTPRPAQPRTTQEIFETVRSRGESNHRIPIVEPIEFIKNRDTLRIDPYLLGIWLGDGTSRGSEFTTIDEEIIFFLGEISKDNGWVLKKKNSQNAGKATEFRINGGLHTELNNLDLLSNKHIPEIYLRSNLDNRVSLLQGLMDTDGTINKAGNYCEIIQKNIHIANGIEVLLNSLSMVARKSIKVINDCDYHRITFRPVLQVFRLTRKVQLYVEAPEQNRWQSILRCTPVESVPVRCITVDAPDKLYCVGKRFTLTHNTVIAINALLKSCMKCQQERPRLAYIAPLYKQAKTVAWDYLCHYSLPIPEIKINQSELRIDYPHGGRIQLFGADNPDSLRGIYLDGVVIDEVAQCPPVLYGEILRPALSDRKGWAMFIGTPKGHDHFFDIYRHALYDPAWYAKMYRASETGILDPDELAQAKLEMSENEFLQEFECDFDISSSFILIPIALVDAAFGREIDVNGAAQRIIGMDVGMSLGGDASAYVIRQGGETIAAGEVRLDNTIEIAGWFKEAFQTHDCQRGFIDSVGYGAGVAHTLQGWEMPVTPVNVGERAEDPEQFSNKKAELWWRVKDFFSDEDCSLPDDRVFRKMGTELSTPEYGYTTAGKIQIEGKKDLTKRGIKSPNLADAFCLTFANSGFFGGVI